MNYNSFNAQNNNLNNNMTNLEYNKNQLEKINENIFILERIIPELKRDYNNLMTKINTNLYQNDNEKMVNNLKSLGIEIEDHKNQLNELKQKQQEIMKKF